MLLYGLLILIAVIIVTLIDGLFFLQAIGTTVWGVIGLIALGIVISLVLDALCALFIRLMSKKINPFSKFFNERKGERTFYEKIGVRKFKDKIPELGKTLKFFDKTKVPENPNSEYMLMFIHETALAELMHLITVFVAPLILVIMPLRYLLYISLPIMIVNILLQIMPIIVQRYTRPKLVAGYKRLLRNEERLAEKENKAE